MARISSYDNEVNPKLSDKLIGTSVGENPVDSTLNFTLQSVLSLFSEHITLQDVLDAGNTATQDINLTGEINTTDVVTTSLIVNGTSELNGAVTLQSANILSGLGVNGDADFQTASFNNDVTFYNPTTFEDTIIVPNIQFANPAVSGEKVLAWNNTDGTLDLGLKGGNVTLQIGQEEVALVVNKSGIDLLEADFKVVKVLGAQGQRLSVDLAQADNDINSATTLGVVTETILNNAEGFITTVGMVNNINATGAKSFGGLETWNDGDVLYLDPVNAGYMTNVKPITPAHLITIGYVVNAANNGKIYVKIDNGYELDELHDVKITTPAGNDLLAYNAVTGFWRNVDIKEVGGVTTSPGVSNYVTKFNSSSTIKPSTLIFDNGTGVGIGTTTINEILNVEGKLALNNSTNSISIGVNTGGTGNQCIAIGPSALSVSTGVSNVALGFRALRDNTSGAQNIAIGLDSLQQNTSGANNIALGARAMIINTTGIQNVSIGTESMEANITGSGNSALGFRALEDNNNGTGNVAIGRYALQANASGISNTAVGQNSLESNTTGGYNVAIGQSSMGQNTSGVNNIAIGYESLLQNTVGDNNIAIGESALLSNTAGSNHIAIGAGALEVANGNRNVAVGAGALGNLLNVGFNTAIGNEAGKFSSSGNNTNSTSSVFIGSGARSKNTNDSNTIVIGVNVFGNGSNTTTIGNTSQTALYFGGNGAGLVLKSPNGTSYKITVDDSGNLVTTAI